METFHIDLHKTKLFGYQPTVTLSVICSIMKGIRAGDLFEPVIVSRYGERDYRLETIRRFPEDLLPDGGHHRSIAHYVFGKPLLCRFPTEEDIRKRKNCLLKYLSITQIPIELEDPVDESDGKTELQRRREMFGKYR